MRRFIKRWLIKSILPNSGVVIGSAWRIIFKKSGKDFSNKAKSCNSRRMGSQNAFSSTLAYKQKGCTMTSFFVCYRIISKNIQVPIIVLNIVLFSRAHWPLFIMLFGSTIQTFQPFILRCLKQLRQEQPFFQRMSHSTCNLFLLSQNSSGPFLFRSWSSPICCKK